MTKDTKETKTEINEEGISRRELIGGTTKVAAVAGAAAVVAGAGGFGAAALSKTASAAAPSKNKYNLAPGELDEYYGFWSGGQSVDVRIMGVPSMRVLASIPVFNMCSATGWGITNESKEILTKGLTPEGRELVKEHGGRYLNGDTHHPHPSFTNGTYDGRYVFINDKANTRVARIRCDVMRTDKIIQVPNVQAIHGLRLQKYPRTGYVFANGEFRVPAPNDGRDLHSPEKYQTMLSAIDGDTMEVAWQVIVSGNLDNNDADYEGKYVVASSYNSEGATNLSGMMEAERDHVVVLNIAAIEAAVKAGKTTTIGDSKVPVLDGRKGKGESFARYIAIPNSPHGVNTDPSGKYIVINGKLSPTVSVLEISKFADMFAGKIKPRDCVVAEPELGLGPLHTAFDNRGNAYTTLFLDSQICKWDVAKAIAAYNGENVNPILEKIDVQYQPGHNHTSMGETKDADGKWLMSLNKFSKDRYINVGPTKPENDQLIDISGDKMKIVHDGPTVSEPHDCTIVHRSKINPSHVWSRDDSWWDTARKQAKKDGVVLEEDNKIIRDGNKVRVYMTSIAPSFGLEEIKVKKGDEVTIYVTNMDDVEDLCHGFTLTNYGLAMEVQPKQTQSLTFTASRAGVYWYYCQWFCHALHMEMRGRLIVEA